MSFAADIVLSAPALTALGNGDAEKASFEAGAYYASDCIGGSYNYMANQGIVSQMGFVAQGSTATPIVPGGFSQADLALHPGISLISTSAATATNIVWGSSGNSATASFPATGVFPNGPPMKSTIIFKTFRQLGNASDRFYHTVGPFTGVANGLSVFVDGFAIQYDFTAADGAWQPLESRLAGGSLFPITDTVPYTPNTWFRLDTYINFQPNKVTMALTQCGTNITKNLCLNATSSFLNAGQPMLIGGAAMSVRRITATGIELGTTIDYFSLTTYAPGRQW